MSEQDNLNLVKKEIDSLNSHNLEASVQNYSDSFKGMDSGYSHPLTKQDIRKDNQAFLSAFPDLRIEVKDWVAQGDKVAISWIAYGTQKNPLETPTMGAIPATNKSITVPGTTFYEIRNGMIVREDTYYDQVAFLTQLGVLSPQQLLSAMRR
jgi:steroid delta-isomerase-like uncharacterized protein